MIFPIQGSAEEGWYVQCDSCNASYWGKGVRAILFETREEAEDAAREKGWLISEGSILCPNCHDPISPGQPTEEEEEKEEETADEIQ
tara:strand:- start:595 stop:855 length:261 start_codon:yes stop_codon:yes gene_type:complete